MIPRRHIRRLLWASFALVTFQGANWAVTVTNTNDSGAGSVRDAIAITPAGGTVDFALTGCPCTIVLTSGDLVITKNLSVLGPGADQLVIDGNDTWRPFFIRGGEHPMPAISVVLAGLKLTRGKSANSGVSFGKGGAIYSSSAALTLRDSVVSHNRAGGGGGLFYEGGGLFIEGSFGVTNRIENCIISDNEAGPSIGYGAGISFVGGGSLHILNSTFDRNFGRDFYGWAGIVCTYNVHCRIEKTTFAGNRNVNNGGGLIGIGINSTSEIIGSTFEGNLTRGVIDNQGATTNIVNSTISGNHGTGVSNSFIEVDLELMGGTVNITNSTIANNGYESAGIRTGGLFVWGHPSFPPVRTSVKNSIVAGNAEADVFSYELPGFSSLGYNVIGDRGVETVFSESGDQAGTSQFPIEPMLEPLALNGGPTRTHALRLNSPALDKGKSSGLLLDQRGFGRPNDNPELANAPGGDGSDIGAYEVQFPVAGAVSITGRVSYNGGPALQRGFVTLTGSSQDVRYAPVNPFGYYRFNNVPLGRTFTIGLRSKGWSVQPQMIFIAEPFTNLDLTANRSF